MLDEYLDLFEIARDSKKTNQVLKRSVSLFRQFLGENNQFEEFSKDVLNKHLRTFFASVLQEDGSELKLSSFLSVQYGICKYIKDVCKVDVVNDSSFRSCLRTFERKATYLRKNKEYISHEDLAKLFSNDNNAFDVNTPSGLQRRVWFDIMYLLYRRRQKHSHSHNQQLIIGSTNENVDVVAMRGMTKFTFAVSTSPDGRRFVYQTVDEADKKHSEDSMNERTVGKAKMYELPGDPHCPVLSFCKYLSKLNPRIECLWQRPLDGFIDPDGPVWYARAPLSKKALAGMMSEISNIAGLSKRYTNHCIRARSVSELEKDYFKARHLVRMSVHMNDASILSYVRPLSDKKQEQIVQSQNQKKPVETVTSCDIDNLDLQEEISNDDNMFAYMSNSSIEKKNMSSAVNHSLNLHQNTASKPFIQQQNCVQQPVSTIDTALLSLGHNNDYQHCLDHLENINNQMIYMQVPQINHNQLNKPRQTFQYDNKPNVRNCSQVQCHFSGNEGKTVEDCGRKTSVSMENSQSMGVYEGYQVFKNDDVKQEPVDPEFDKVAGSQNEGKEETSKSLQDVLKQMVENPNKELTLNKVVGNVVLQNEVLLAESNSQALKPNIRTVKPESVEQGAVSVGSILTPRIPTVACSKNGMLNNNDALAEVDVTEANESNCDPDFFCAVGSKNILMTIHGQPEQRDITYYWCNFCSYKSEKKETMLQHIMEHRFSCNYCKFQAFSRATVILHCRKEHESFSETAATLKYCTHLPDLLYKNGMKKKKQDEGEVSMSKRARFECTESLDMKVEEEDSTVTSREVKQTKVTKPSSAKFKQHTAEGNTENSGQLVISSVISGQQAVSAALKNTKQSEPVSLPPKQPEPEKASRPQPVATSTIATRVTSVSGLCWTCKYCCFVTYSTLCMKIHFHAKHPGTAIRYIGMSVTSKEEMARIKASDAKLVSCETKLQEKTYYIPASTAHICPTTIQD